MKLSKLVSSNVLSASLALVLSGPVVAEPAFPPPHLSADAHFGAGANNGEKPAMPWYEQSDAERKAGLVAQEIRQPSPYPSMYYFYTIRNYANDESGNLARLREQASVNNRNDKMSVM